MKRALLFSLFLWPLVQAQPSDDDLLFLVSQGGKTGYIDRTGRVAIPLQFGGAWDFHEGRACVQLSADPRSNYAMIDREGRAVTPARFHACGAFSEGLAPVALGAAPTRYPEPHGDRGEWGYIDRAGGMVIEARYRKAREFSEGLAAVENGSGKWGFIDTLGRTVIGFQFDSASSFSEGLAVVVSGRKYVYIDHHGEVAIDARFQEAHEFSEGLALVRVRGDWVPPSQSIVASKNNRKTFLYIDRSGRTRIRLKAMHANGFVEGLAEFGVIGEDGYLHCGYIDRTGAKIIPARFGGCDEFSEGLASVLVNGKWRYIDKTGNVRLHVPYVQVRSFHGGLAFFLDGPTGASARDSGYIDKTGKVVWRSTD